MASQHVFNTQQIKDLLRLAEACETAITGAELQANAIKTRARDEMGDPAAFQILMQSTDESVRLRAQATHATWNTAAKMLTALQSASPHVLGLGEMTKELLAIAESMGISKADNIFDEEADELELTQTEEYFAAHPDGEPIETIAAGAVSLEDITPVAAPDFDNNPVISAEGDRLFL